MSRLIAVVSGYFRTLSLLAFPHAWRGVGLRKRSANKLSYLVPLVFLLILGLNSAPTYAQQLPANCAEMGGADLCSMPLVGDWNYAFAYNSLPVQECSTLPYNNFRSEEAMLIGARDYIY